MASFGNITHGPKSKITSKFGSRIHPVTKKQSNHKGIDLRAEVGTPILSISDGVVVDSAMRNDFCGGTLKIDHGIIDGKKMETRFCHLSSISKKVGDKVKQGEEVAKSGKSGRVTGPHIHFEVIVDGQHVNPEPYYNGSITYQKKSDVENDDLPVPDEDEATGKQISPELSKALKSLTPGTKGLDLFGGKLDPLLKGLENTFGKMNEEVERIKNLMNL